MNLERVKKPNSTIVNALWWTYGRTYDGLRDFYPYKLLVADVLRRADVLPGQTVLDLGCGTGNQLQALAGIKNVTLHGVDGASSMASVASAKLEGHSSGVKFRIVTDDILSFLKGAPSGYYDRILSTNVVYALDERDIFWRELLRVLKPEGRAVIATAISTDSKSLIKDQLKHAGLLRSLKPKLLGVFIFDALINVFG